MPETNMYYGEAVDVSELYIAEVTGDDTGAYAAGTPKLLAPFSTIAKETSSNTKTRYYSGKPLFVDTTEGETKLTVVVPGLTVKARAELCGKTYDTTKGMMYDDGNTGEKYFAVGYCVHHAGGVDEYAWLLKGKFSIPKDEAETKTTDINEKTLSVEYTAITTTTKYQLATGKKGGCKAVYADTADSNFKGADTWFNAVQKPPAVSA